MSISHLSLLVQVTSKDQPFQNIMRCYRLQPQAQSHVSIFCICVFFFCTNLEHFAIETCAFLDVCVWCLRKGRMYRGVGCEGAVLTAMSICTKIKYC